MSPSPLSSPSSASSSAADFDFLLGHWRVKHRRLNERLANCDTWTEFDGTVINHKLMGGLGNVDDTWLNLPGGAYHALAMRSCDEANGIWNIWWLDARHPGELDAPMKGCFEGGVGQFYADERFNGRPIKVRFTWQRLGADLLHWSQAFSADGGATWEPNWHMEFARAAGPNTHPD